MVNRYVGVRKLILYNKFYFLMMVFLLNFINLFIFMLRNNYLIVGLEGLIFEVYFKRCWLDLDKLCL